MALGCIFMNRKFCYIFGAAETTIPLKFLPQQSKDFIIAADKGYSYIKKAGLTPDLIVGDFDSYGKVPVTDVEIVKFPTVKDDTDLMIAINQGLDRGYSDFIIYGASGGKTDFTIANFQILSKLAKKGCTAYLVGNNNIATVICNSSVSFDASYTGRISILSLTEKSVGVTLTGLKYTLNSHVLTFDEPLGISNEFIGKDGNISVSEGILAIIYDDSNDLLQ